MVAQAQRFFIQEAALTEALGVVRKAEVEANKRLHDEGQNYTTLLAKVVPLHAEIATLKDATAANQAKITSLDERSVTREVLLGKVEADLAGKNEALGKIKAELAEQAKLLEERKKELEKRTEALAQAEKEKAALTEDFKKAEAKLLTDAAEAYGAGFEDALSQVVCKHPERLCPGPFLETPLTFYTQVVF